MPCRPLPTMSHTRSYPVCQPKDVKQCNRKVCIFDIDNTLTIYEKEGSRCPGRITTPLPIWPTQSGTTQHVVDTLRSCDQQGFILAIATAEAGSGAWSKKQELFLTSLAKLADLPEKAVVPENRNFGSYAWMDSPLYQNSCTALGYNRYNYCESAFCRDEPCEFSVSKIPSFMNILNYLKIDPNNYNKSIVFDDGLTNLTDATKLGLQVCQASPGCGGQECRGGCGIPASCMNLVMQQPPSQPRSGTPTPFKLNQYHPDSCSGLDAGV